MGVDVDDFTNGLKCAEPGPELRRDILLPPERRDTFHYMSGPSNTTRVGWALPTDRGVHGRTVHTCVVLPVLLRLLDTTYYYYYNNYYNDYNYFYNYNYYNYYYYYYYYSRLAFLSDIYLIVHARSPKLYLPPSPAFASDTLQHSNN